MMKMNISFNKVHHLKARPILITLKLGEGYIFMTYLHVRMHFDTVLAATTKQN